MKRFGFTSFFLFSVAVFGCLCLVGCSDGDDGDGPDTDDQTPENNLPEASRKFLGAWKGYPDKGKMLDIVFLADGTVKCRRAALNVSAGSWTFNPETDILATTVDKQWTVTLSNESSWAGISIESVSHSYSFLRDESANAIYLLLANTEWSDGDRELAVREPGGSLVFSYPGTGNTINRYITFELTEEGDDLSDSFFDYELKVDCNDWRSAGGGKLTIADPYTPSKTKITLTGTVEGTFSLKR